MVRKSELPAGPYSLAIDYGQPLAAIIEAGNYDFANRLYITDVNFPVSPGDAAVEAFLVQLGRKPSDEEALAEMAHLNLRPATMIQGLAFGAQYPEIQRGFGIVFLGSVWTNSQGRRYGGYLMGGPTSRGVDLYCLGRDRRKYDRFLAVPK